MKRVLALTVFTLVSIAAIGVACADSGVVNPSTKISEPGQNAVIGWNETHEKMILSTDFRHEADGKIKAVRVIPFPSLPSVKESDDKVFEEIDKILSDLMYSVGGYKKDIGLSRGGVDRGAVVKWSTDIGSHNLTAYEVNSSEYFGEIVKRKFKGEDIQDWEMDSSVENIIEDYLERDIRYFVIDVVDLEGRGGKAEPILYEFQTDELYYPLVISGLSERVGGVKVAVFSKKMMGSEEFERSYLELQCYDWMDKIEVKDVSPEISSMFDKDKIAFTYFVYRWYDLDDLRDISTSTYATYPEKPTWIPYVFAVLFVGISSPIIWYELRYRGGGSNGG